MWETGLLMVQILKACWLVFSHNQQKGDFHSPDWRSEEFFFFLFEGRTSGVCTLSLGPGSSCRSSVVSICAADVFNPIEWVQNSWVLLIDWSQDGASPRLGESAQKMLAETVCFHMKDFGEARSFLQSLKQKGRQWIRILISQGQILFFFFSLGSPNASFPCCHHALFLLPLTVMLNPNTPLDPTT